MSHNSQLVYYCSIFQLQFQKKSFSTALQAITASRSLWAELMLSNQQRSSLSSASRRTPLWDTPNGHEALAVTKWQSTVHRKLYEIKLCYIQEMTKKKNKKNQRISPVQALNARGRLRLWMPGRCLALFRGLSVCSSLAS